MMIESTGQKILKVLLYIFLILMAAVMLLPFLWMLSASLKQDRDVFTFPIQWIPADPEWSNYQRIWTQIPLLTYILNTVKLTIIVTLLQLFTSSFAAYAFSSRDHMALVLFHDSLKPSGQRILMIFIDTLILLFAILIITIGGFKLALSARQEFSALLGIPRSLVYAMAPISGIFIILAQIINLYEDVTGTKIE